MSRQALQMQINLGAASHVGLLHHSHKSNVYIATITGDEFRQQVYPHRAAIEQAQVLEIGGAVNCYVAQNPTQYGQSRGNLTVSCLQNCWVDLDTYNVPELAGMDSWQVFDLIRDAHPDLPTPTMIASSGRGMYLIWTFVKTKPASWLRAWNEIENNLVELLKPFGADPKAKAAAGLLRIAGTENSKSLSIARYEQISAPITFESLQRYSNGLTRARKQQEESQRRKRVASKPAVRRGNENNVRTLRNLYTMHFARLEDYRRLAELRGGRLTDLRNAAIFCYSVSAAWYCNSVEELRQEIECFIDDFISEPEKYKRRKMPVSVFNRKQQSIEGITIQWQGKERDARYTMKNSTIIQMLEITPEEQQHLKIIITTAEKRRRWNEKRNQRRWDEGKLTRKAYENAAAERRQMALQLSAEGRKQAEIAEALNVSRRSVKMYLRKAI